ncbi:J domain-containing protein [Collimonas pratensis]|uniref:DnaJ domain protein n=1 Tax=Collimonas pratensis TaxID=279113 RepID=A0A127Q4P8_9BURK|nr:J domain-containing protein [Collimonas pratensis]AMP04622.1 dnaJ domain protein [Collimonas pratensis]
MHSEWNKWIWSALDIPPSDDERTVKRAYAKRLKVVRPDDDPEKFQALRQAYERALALIQQSFAGNAGHGNAAALPAAAKAVDPAGETMAESLAHPGLPAAKQTIILHQDQASLLAAAQPAFDAGAAADTLWQALMLRMTPGKLRYTSAILADFVKAENFENFDVRDAFEFHAMQYCAQQNADQTARAAMVEHFGWTDNAQHLFQHNPDLARTALARYRADQGYKWLENSAITGSQAALALIQTALPKRSMRLYQHKFVAEMQELVQRIRWHLPELLAYRLNPELFAWWEKQAHTPRLSMRSGVIALLLGALVFGFLATWCASLIPESLHDATAVTAFVAIEVGALWLAYLAIKRGASQRLKQWLYAKHLTNWVQVGWMPLFILCSTAAMFDLSGDAMHGLIDAGLLLCALVSLFAAWRFLNVVGFVIVALLTVVLGGVGGLGLSIFPGFGFWECCLIALPVAIMLVRGGEYHYGLLKFSDNSLWKIRVAWMAIAGLIFYLGTLATPEHYIVPAVAAWLWSLLSIPIVNVYLGSGATGMRVYAFGLVTMVASAVLEKANPAIHLTSTMLLVMALFIGFNSQVCRDSGRKFS